MHTVNIKTINRRQHGFSLIEVLIAVLVLAIGLLGMAQMQANGMRSTHGAYLRTQATLLAGDVLESMRANLTAARTGNYNVTYGNAPTGSTIADDDVNGWLTNVALLPSGQGQISTNGNDVTVAIRWTSIRQNENTGQAKTFTVDTTL